METINYENLIPAQPEEDVVAFAIEQGAFQQNYLIYQSGRVYDPLEDRMKDMAQITCSACGEQFYAEKIKAEGCGHSYASAPFGWWNDAEKSSVISGQGTSCPCCGMTAETVHVGNMRLYNGEVVDDDYVTVLSRLPVEGRRDRLLEESASSTALAYP